MGAEDVLVQVGAIPGVDQRHQRVAALSRLAGRRIRAAPPLPPHRRRVRRIPCAPCPPHLWLSFRPRARFPAPIPSAPAGRGCRRFRPVRSRLPARSAGRAASRVSPPLRRRVHGPSLPPRAAPPAGCGRPPPLRGARIGARARKHPGLPAHTGTPPPPRDEAPPRLSIG